MTRLRTTALGLVKCAAALFTQCELPPSAEVLRAREENHATSAAPNEQRPGIGNNDVAPLTLPIMVDAIIAGLAFYRYRKENIIDNPQQFVELINEIFLRSFGRMPSRDESITPIRMAIIDRWNSHYAAVPLDFAGPQLAASNYVNYVFAAFHDAGLVRFLGAWGKATNFFGSKRARLLLKRQNSPFAQAASFQIYKFYPDAWEKIFTHMLWTEPSDTAGYLTSRGLSAVVGTNVRDRFAEGFTHETPS